jgi:hypothetical protein
MEFFFMSISLLTAFIRRSCRSRGSPRSSKRRRLSFPGTFENSIGSFRRPGGLRLSKRLQTSLFVRPAGHAILQTVDYDAKKIPLVQ